MFRAAVIACALFIGLFIAALTGITSGRFLRYFDQHSEAAWAPEAFYRLGQASYLLQDLPQAATCFWRVEVKHESSRFAEDAAFYHAQVREDNLGLSREEVIAMYETYLQRYPKGKFAAKAESRIQSYRSGAR